MGRRQDGEMVGVKKGVVGEEGEERRVGID